ncbi:hypothetical protein [Planobispora longispora]|uniref:Uncharacterized protein n=1 Tax=Planobispora longispora TaxID=28887 RepID=A0A8J3RN44_9ACTN|nr:hypothetical protein [Planobispora longispora]GIH76644.1 hypothetical protein Plo01_30730 [Planobispora longispora]
MAHSDQPAVPAGKPFWNRPPIWLRALGVPIALAVTLRMFDGRGLSMAVVAGVVYGALAIGLLAWDRFVIWGREHPLLDVLASGPVMFITLALVTPLSPAVCAATAAGFTVLLAVLKHLQRRRPSQSGTGPAGPF